MYQLLEDQELRLQDQYFSWRHILRKVLKYEPISASDIVIVSIDNDSVRHLKGYPPWPRQLYAALLKQLRKAGAQVIALDLVLDGPSPILKETQANAMSRFNALVPKGLIDHWQLTAQGDDQALVDELRQNKTVVLASNVEVSTNLSHGRTQFLFHTPYDPFIYALGGNSSSLGNVVVEPDHDALVRKASLVFTNFQHMGPFFHSFGLTVVEKAWETHSVLDLRGKLFLHDRAYPQSFRINFLDPSESFLIVPLWKTLNWKQHYTLNSTTVAGELFNDRTDVTQVTDGNPFKDKIVLVGFHHYLGPSEGLPRNVIHETRFLPFNTFLTPVTGITKPMSGVELQANIIANILSTRFLSEPEWWEEVLIVLFVSFLFARMFSGLHGRPWSMLATTTLFSLVWLTDSFLCFVYLECLVPVVVPVLGVALPCYLLVLIDQNLFAFQERRRHTRVFRDLAPLHMAEEIDRRQVGELGLEGKKATVTTLLCQLHNFPTSMDGLLPETIVQSLNECLTLMISSIYEHSGIVDRIWHYGVLAIWGAPLPMQELSQARLSASCYLDIEQCLTRLYQTWIQEGKIEPQKTSLKLRAGINTGEAICGQIGTDTHAEYGAIGDSVDFTLRLELINNRYGTRCIIGESTAQLVSQKFEIRELDKVKFDASDKPQHIYELLCPTGKLPGAMEEATVLYKQGLAAMEKRNFTEAERLFNSILRLAPDDKPTMLMLERCQSFLAKPPEPTWDGSTMLVYE
ncbi:MAG: CHASE2 domain-containing protein [Candidatus Melainabacteria bacterium]|nr:CHASE2 domain-containing protein [Candidatus Melainabacteria bacterium]